MNLPFFPSDSGGKRSPAVTRSGLFDDVMGLSFFMIALLSTLLSSIPFALAGNTSPSIKEVALSYEDSPFGFFNSYIDNSITRPVYAAYGGMSMIQSFYRDINIHWNRMGKLPKFVLQNDGSYYWAELDEYVNTANKNNVYSLITIAPGEERYLPPDGAPYLKLVRELAQRYSSTVKYYQIHNEVNGGVFWKDTPQNYATLVRATSNVIREVCPDCKIVLGSSINIGENGKPQSIEPYFGPLLEELNKDGQKYFDIFDYHFFAPQGYTPETYYQALDREMDSLKNLLSKYGYPQVKIWITETLIPTTYGMSDPFIRTLPKEYQKITEKQQALALFKTHILALSKGVKKIFCSSLTEGPWSERDPLYDNVGLIRHPAVSGSTEKKLSYYTYKKMVEMLEGSNWNNIQTIHKKDGLYIFKFVKQGKPIWVAWNDNKKLKSVTLSDIASARMEKIEAIPKFQLGEEVRDHSIAFVTELKNLSAKTKTATTGGKTIGKNKITITLGEIPVFLEEK